MMSPSTCWSLIKGMLSGTGRLYAWNLYPSPDWDKHFKAIVLSKRINRLTYI